MDEFEWTLEDEEGYEAECRAAFAAAPLDVKVRHYAQGFVGYLDDPELIADFEAEPMHVRTAVRHELERAASEARWVESLLAIYVAVYKVSARA